nr:MAG TPA: hypothetical protein [Caudoviricetes sp.]
MKNNHRIAPRKRGFSHPGSTGTRPCTYTINPPGLSRLTGDALTRFRSRGRGHA